MVEIALDTAIAQPRDHGPTDVSRSPSASASA
jgi:hypothetical protein